ncbi:MAG: hypothetical protein HUK15_06665, partial [Bacteroidales bacterium]|nr:hypothetical protein [Bacteroidales bacterium]
MRKIILTVSSLFAMLLAMTAFGQNQPISFTNEKMLSEIDNVIVSHPDFSVIQMEDAADVKNGEMYKVARIIDVNLNMSNCGTTDILPDGTKVWRLLITSDGAKALKVMCENFYLPQGSSLFVYNENRNQVLHLTSADNPRGSYYSPKMIQGGKLYLEYVAPSGVAEDAVLDIDGISYFYRGVESYVGYYEKRRDPDFQSSGNCEVNVNCAAGQTWQTQKKGVAEIFVIEGNMAGFCTGSLVNNTSNDGTPYFLTADHCGGVDGAASMNRWEFYFNYEATGCTT